MNALIIEGLNMKALNSLVWALAVLAKIAVIGVAFLIVLFGLAILVSVFE